jgi:hypothetical protein
VALIWAAMIFLSPESCESTASPECNATTDEFDCNSKESPAEGWLKLLALSMGGNATAFPIGIGFTVGLTKGGIVVMFIIIIKPLLKT